MAGAIYVSHGLAPRLYSPRTRRRRFSADCDLGVETLGPVVTRDRTLENQRVRHPEVQNLSNPVAAANLFRSGRQPVGESAAHESSSRACGFERCRRMLASASACPS